MKKTNKNQINNFNGSKKGSLKSPKLHGLINSVLGSFTALSVEYLYLTNNSNK